MWKHAQLLPSVDPVFSDLDPIVLLFRLTLNYAFRLSLRVKPSLQALVEHMLSCVCQ